MSSKIVLVLNCGSSSLKFSIIDVTSRKEHVSGLAECLNMSQASIKWNIEGIKYSKKLNDRSTHNDALRFMINIFFTKTPELLKKLSAIGHRIVHGGKHFTQSIIIDDKVLKGIKDAISFAPLHNPAHIIGIQAAFTEFPQLISKNVAVFDTAFHQTMPEASYLYALPHSLYTDHDIRRYGAHGISHFYISCEAARLLCKSINKVNLITCHLGNGGSVSAIRNGKCVDTSMGMTPLEGLVMGTRSGDIDPAIIFYLHNSLGFSISKINTMLTKESGLLGITGVTSDCRYIEENYDKKDSARLAMDIYCHRLAKYISSYTALMDGRLDALIFSGGIGENSFMVRQFTLDKLSLIGFKIDPSRNFAARFGQPALITTDVSCPAFVIPTNEEIVIAQDTADLTK